VGTSDFAVGIDLGTTNSVVAYVAGDRVEFVPDDGGHLLHPSVVAFKQSGSPIVGLPARMRRLVDPENTVFSAKRLIGQPFSGPRVQAALRHLPYRVEPGPNDEPIVVTRGGRHSVGEIYGLLFAHLKQAAEAHLERPVTHCVVTVPAHFNDGQRKATRRAAEHAGFLVLRILNEPTAAALAHGLDRGLDQRLLVYDMGGGTFDVTVLSIENNLFEVMATGGDAFLGGDDMDRAVAELLARRFREVHGVDLHEHRHAVAKAIIAAEQIKMQLSEKPAVEGSVSELHYGEGGVPLTLDFRITREELEAVIAGLVDRSMACVDRVLADASLLPGMVDGILLVGGATRVPLIRRRIEALLGKPPLAVVDPMMAVAAGAAVQANLLLDPPRADTAPPLLMDVTGHGLGVGLAGGYTDLLIERNAAIPAERARSFTTSHDNQTRVEIKVCEGDSKVFEDNHLLGVLRLDGLPPQPRGATKISVSFLLDSDGILQVKATDEATGRLEQATLRVHGVDRDGSDDRGDGSR